MDELQLYQLMENILKHSTVIEGRFHVAENYGNDLNSGNLGDIISTEIKPKKYPISVILPPVDTPNYTAGWSRFRIEQFFLCTGQYTGSGAIKSPANSTNTSKHPTRYDWKDMRECAIAFRQQFEEVIRAKGLLNQVRPVSGSTDTVRRVSNMGNDRLNGVLIVWQLDVNFGCDIADYDEGAIAATQLPDEDIHPLHKH